MEGISIGIRNNFKGIGNEKCSESIDSVINRFYQVRKVLNNIKITEKIVSNIGENMNDIKINTDQVTILANNIKNKMKNEGRI